MKCPLHALCIHYIYTVTLQNPSDFLPCARTINAQKRDDNLYEDLYACDPRQLSHAFGFKGILYYLLFRRPCSPEVRFVMSVWIFESGCVYFYIIVCDYLSYKGLFRNLESIIRCFLVFMTEFFYPQNCS